MFSFPEASQALQARLEYCDSGQSVRGVSIDTRKIRPGDLFVALRGTAADGHDFLEKAFREGAAGALIRKDFFDRHIRTGQRNGVFRNLLVVDEPETALQNLAAWYRSRFTVKTIGVTGSVGKTTTKEFLTYLLKQGCEVLSTQGNLNNHLGLPLTLLGLHSGHRFCVAELGANHPGEIRLLANILKPDAGIITQVAPAHLEGFGSLEAVCQAKLELFESLRPGSYAVLPDDNSMLLEKAARLKLKIIRVGSREGSEFRITKTGCDSGRVIFEINGQRQFSFPGVAAFLVPNAAMALAVLEVFGIGWDRLAPHWEDLRLPGGRFEWIRLRENVTVIYDGYNASPLAFRKALDTFEGLKTAGRKILVMADMLELGREEMKYHEELGYKIAACHFDFVAGYGSRIKRATDIAARENASCVTRYFESREEIVKFLKTVVNSGDTILLKASRRMKIEEILKQITEWLENRQTAHLNC